MSEQFLSAEFAKPQDTLLVLAKEYGTAITSDMQQVMDRMHAGMELAEQRELYSQLHILLEKADMESPDQDQMSQVKRQIGTVLITAHMMQATGEPWGRVELELLDALEMVDQTADAGYEDFYDLGDALSYQIVELTPQNIPDKVI